MQNYRVHLQKMLAQEGEDIFPFVPIFLASGIAAYFAMPYEPSLVFSIMMLLGSMLILWYAKRHNYLIKLCLLFTIFCAGFTVANIKTILTATYLLPEATGNIEIIGEVEQIQHLEKGNRLWIKNINSNIDNVERVRLSVKTDIQEVQIGNIIKLKAVLLPPPLPMVQDGFNFARYSFFKGINAIGYATSRPIIVNTGLQNNIWHFFGNLRHYVTIRIHQTLSQPISGIAVGILVGDASSIPIANYEVVKAAGISHLLAISGMHMVVVVAILFVSMRFLILRSEYLSLRVNAKKIAAAVALIGSLLYLMLALMPVSAQRAFIMSTIVLLGILLDKNSTPMRAVVIGAILILIITPHEVLNPSLQMSFAASVSLVVSYSFFDKILPFNRTSSIAKIAHYFFSIVLSTFIAGMATAPFVIFHFHEYSTYSILTNLIAIPLNDFLVMPLGLLALLTMPFSLEWLPLKLMGYGIELIYQIASFISGLKFSTIPALNISPVGIAIISFCGFMFMICKSQLRFLFFIPFVCGFILPSHDLQPDILIEQKGNLFAVRYEGNLYYSSNRKARFIREIWGNTYANQSPTYSLAQLEDENCNPHFCSFSKNRNRVAIVTNRYHLPQNVCQQHDLIVNLTSEQLSCSDKVITRNQLKLLGNLALWLTPKSIVRRGAHENLHKRPWHT